MNLYISWYLCNDRRLFTNTKANSINFVIVVKQVIWIEEIDTVFISLIDGNNIELYNIALVLSSDLNLISFEQLQEIRITYYDSLVVMTLMTNPEIIPHTKRKRNLFILNLTQLEKAIAVRQKAMVITKEKQPAHFVSQNKPICLWYYCLAHMNNTHVVKISKLVDGIKLDICNKEYNPAKLHIHSVDSDIFDSSSASITYPQSQR